MKDYIKKIQQEIIEIRHAIHSYPELKYEEHETAKLVFQTLKKFGFENITAQIAGTGVSVVLDSGKPGKTVGLRADMDALPITELTSLPYSSQNHEKMHACGHDGHTATLLAAASALKQNTDKFKGRIKFIFQPAEEGGLGALEMIKAGVLENPKVDAIFGYHNLPFALGKIGIRSGSLMSGVDFFSIKIKGKGGHGATPHLCVDPILIGSTLVQALQSIASRFIPSSEQFVLSITQFHGGTAPAVIPEDVTLTGTMRTMSASIRETALQHFHKIIEGVAHSFSVQINVDITLSVPATVNTVAETKLVEQTATNLFGKNNIVQFEQPVMFAEDFSFFLEKVPGCYFFVGNGENSPGLHTPTYDFQDNIIPIAASLLAQTAVNYLNQN